MLRCGNSKVLRIDCYSIIILFLESSRVVGRDYLVINNNLRALVGLGLN
jgi:hypothetical protein